MQPLLGYLDADHADEKQRFLQHVFVDTSATRLAQAHTHPFVIGRKGAGKSAVIAHLNFDAQYRAHVPLQRSDYEPLQRRLSAHLLAHQRTTSTSAPGATTFIYYVWTYILHLCVFHCFLQRKQGVANEAECDVLRRFCAQFAPHTRSPAHSAFEAALSILRSTPSDSLHVADAERQMLGALSADPFARATQAARTLARTRVALITIDTFEQYDITDTTIYPLREMCRAVKSFSDNKHYLNATIKCFLPTEVAAEHAFSENRAKHMAMTAPLTWTYAELVQFIARRYCLYLSGLTAEPCRAFAHALRERLDDLTGEGVTSSRMWRDRVWRHFAPDYVINRLGWAEDSAAYLIRHTQKRPRECLCCMNHIVELAATHPEFPRLAPRAIVDGIHCRDNLDMLVTDSLAAFPVPGYGNRAHQFVAHLLSGESRLINASVLPRILRRAQPILRQVDDPRSAARMALVRSGLVGVVRLPAREWIGPDRKQCRYYVTDFEYSQPGSVVFNENDTLAMHPMLGDFMSAPDSSEYAPGVVYHRPEADELVDELCA